MKIAVDAIGSDARPVPDIQGAIDAVREYGVEVLLVGPEDRIRQELAKTANRVKPGAIPFDISLFFPAYSPQLLHKLGFIDNTIPLETLQKKYAIKDYAKKLYTKDDFSTLLRNELEN